jgi:kynurenine formamidase
MTLIDQLAGARVFDLEQPRFAGMPVHPAHKPGYFYGLHRRHRDSYRPEQHGPRSGASGVLTMMEHSGTHIDALCHQACDMTFYGGLKVDELERQDGYRQLGAETIKPLLGRGVLLDIAGLKGVAQAGDVLLVRTGYATSWTDEATYLNAAGVSKSGNIWAAEQRAVAVGADNMAWDCMTERDPDTKMTLFGHAHLLVTHGIHIIENLNLEELAAAKIHEFGFVGIPLKFRGATGSPIRPIALAG